MKKIFTLIMVTIMFCIGTIPASAASSQEVYSISDVQTQQEIQYLDDGSYFISVIETEDNNISIMSTTTTKSKTSTYYDANGIAKWYVKVTGTFTYGNGTSICTSSSVTSNSYDTSI